MRRALALAEKGLFTTTPNPRVGCVITRGESIVGEGWHERAGGPHAEIAALIAAGDRARGATVYVNLEPCSHYGRTPPCADALIRAGVARVVAAVADPNPLVAGSGLARLQAAGIEVACGVLEKEAAEMNIGFFARMTRGTPWVRMKSAASLDGRTALHNGRSQWITSEAARNDGHWWRARACAVLTGIGTVLEDDPQLTVRAIDTPRQPRRIVIDSALQISPQARILAGGGTWIAAAQPHPEKEAQLRAAGAKILMLPNPHGKVELRHMLEELGRRGVNELHVEAGFKLNGSLIREHCADELLVYLAPKLLGDAQGMFQLPPLARLQDAAAFRWHDVRMIGEDLRLIARRADHV